MPRPTVNSRLIRHARRLSIETGADIDELLAAAAKVSHANPRLKPEEVVAVLRATVGKNDRKIPDGPPNR